MDFLTTARLLMKIQKDHPGMRYTLLDNEVVITISVDDGVAEDFASAAKMFEPV